MIGLCVRDRTHEVLPALRPSAIKRPCGTHSNQLQIVRNVQEVGEGGISPALAVCTMRVPFLRRRGIRTRRPRLRAVEDAV